jgi:hypothetical protein
MGALFYSETVITTHKTDYTTTIYILYKCELYTVQVVQTVVS